MKITDSRSPAANPLPWTDRFPSRHIGPDADDIAAMLKTCGCSSLDAMVDTAVPKGIRLDKMGKGHHRFYIVDLASSGRMPSGVPHHEYSFSLEEAEHWLALRDKEHENK